MNYCYEYPRPMVTVDIILISKNNNNVLLIKRKNNPFQNCWAFPGGFVDMDETLEHAALRELNEETSISNVGLTQFKAFSAINRDPRGRNIAVVFWSLINEEDVLPKAGDDAKEVAWFNLNNLPTLAFDHKIIIEELIKEKF